MGTLKATEKLERLLSMIPWIIENDGPKLSVISQRFNYPEEHLLNDLTKVLFMVGPYPHTPDTLIEVIVEDGRVWISQAEWLSRPIRLTSEQGFSILRKAKLMELIIGSENGSDLKTAIMKLESSLGQTKKTFEVDIPMLATNTWSVINQAIETKTQLVISYYSYAKDETSTRTVHPAEISNRDNNQYLFAYCETANDFRLFRLDRIIDVNTSDKAISIPADKREAPNDDESWKLENSSSLVSLKITPEDSWITATYPIENSTPTDDGYIKVDLYVTGIAWLKRLLIRLSPKTEILKAPKDIPIDLAKITAQEILDRYKE
tara:strand:- start:111 stop:1070 length:960 start_codon:yes stop_codon:yes gene_type:complete